MLYVDIPTHDEMASLSGVRHQGCVSIYLKTTPITQDTDLARIELGNLTRDAATALQARGLPKAEIEAVTAGLDALRDDDDFWAFQAHSLAIFATPGRISTWRLPNDLASLVMVSDRLHLQPLFRALTFPHSAYILALSENALRLISMHSDLPPQLIDVPEMPKDAASAAGKASIKGRAHYNRMTGTEGQNIRLEQYVRKIDAALRNVLTGRETPLIVAATGRLASLIQQMSSYPHLLAEGIADSPDRMTAAELVAAARPILDKAYAAEVEELGRLYHLRAGEARATSDIAVAARAATFGAVQTLLVDIDRVMPGLVDDDTGAVTFLAEDDPAAYGVLDEIAVRAFASGARILGVRREDLPDQHELAAILRYPI